jgi:hypothetical protein
MAERRSSFNGRAASLFLNSRNRYSGGTCRGYFSIGGPSSVSGSAVSPATAAAAARTSRSSRSPSSAAPASTARAIPRAISAAAARRRASGCRRIRSSSS